MNCDDISSLLTIIYIIIIITITFTIFKVLITRTF
jgi:hypothetical protein